MRKSALLPLLACMALVALPAELAGGQRRTSDVRLIAALSGANEVDQNGNPGAGDADGYGAAAVTVRRNRRVCWHIAARNIGTIVGGHIHEGSPTQNGPIVVPFFDSADLDPSGRGCTRAPRAVWRELRRTPSAFYVNVHTSDFPGGAIRGQLSR
jgi:hypothetical protein